jgi:hypothetical protein
LALGAALGAQLTVGFVPIPADDWLTIRAKSVLLSKKTMQTLRCLTKDCRFLGKTAPETQSGAEIRAGHADVGHAGWNKQKAANVTTDLLFGNHPSGIVQSRAPRSSIAASFILCKRTGPFRRLNNI